MFSLPDNLILAAANVALYARNPRLVARYRRMRGRWPNVARPGRFSERMLWRKLVDHNPQFVVFADKLAAQEFIRARCPDLRLPQTLWVGRDAAEIPDELLRGDVFVKANHGCGFNHRVRGGQVDRPALRKKTSRWMRSFYGRKNGEWAYRHIERKLFVEAAIGDAEAGMFEIQVRASNGRAIMGTITGRTKLPDQWHRYLDAEGNPTLGSDNAEGSPIQPLPKGVVVAAPYRRAVEYARQLSVGVDYARFDFMWNGTELFGGEITVYPAAGLADPGNASANAVMLAGWDLAQSHFLKSPPAGWAGRYAAALRRQLATRQRRWD